MTLTTLDFRTRLIIESKYGGCSMIVFSCQEDEEAEDEDNNNSRKDGCLCNWRCYARDLGDKWRTVEMSFIRVNQL